MRRSLPLATCLLLAPLLGGCLGETIPTLQEPYESPQDEQSKENFILSQVKCELQQGIQNTLRQFKSVGRGQGYGAEWLKAWSAKIDLKITADEKATFSPSFSYLPNAFNLNLGANSTSDATRVEEIGVIWTVPEILKDPFTHPCTHIRDIQIESNLKIDEFILNKATLARIPGNIQHSNLGSPFNVFNYEATFVVTYGGTLNPSWKFSRFEVNDKSTLFDASRSRTDYLTITMGPTETDNSGGAHLAPAADDVHLAALIGQAVAKSIRSSQP